MINRIKTTAKTISEVLYGVRCIPDLAAMLRADARQNASNEYRIAVHELEAANRKLADRDAILATLERECAAAQAELDELARWKREEIDAFGPLLQFLGEKIAKCDWVVVGDSLAEKSIELVSRLESERDALAADLARISSEMGLPPTIGPADGELRRMLESGREAIAKLEWLTRWREQDVEPCPFPETAWVEWSLNGSDDGGCCRVKAMHYSESWRHTVDCLKYRKEGER